MHVFLTGATGFLGSYVAEELLARGHDVTAAIREGSDTRRLAKLEGRYRRAALDLSDPSSIASAFSDGAYDGLCHLAWAGVFNADRNDPAQAGNVVSTARLFEAAAKAGVGVGLGVGSQAEYGPYSQIITEDCPSRATTLYGVAKNSACRFAEEIARQHGMRFAWTRVFSTYGPGDHMGWMIPGLVLKLLAGERPALTKGEQLWDFLFAQDAARAMATILEDKRASGVFNLGSGDAPSLRSTIETIRDLIDPNLPLGFGDIAYRPDQVMHLQADMSRLKALGWAPQTSLSEGLKKTVAAIRAAA